MDLENTSIHQIRLVSKEGRTLQSTHVQPLRSSGEFNTERKFLEFKPGSVSITSSNAVEVPATTISNDETQLTKTRHFMVACPDAPSLSYAVGSGEEVATFRINEPEFQLSAGKPRTANKLKTRQIAQECNGLKQPSWNLIPDLVSEKGTELRFSKISFADLPIADLFDQNSPCSSIIFEDLEKGFSLVRNGDKLHFASNHQLLRSMAEQFPDGLNQEQVHSLLTQISDSEFSVSHLTLQTAELRANQIIDHLKNLDDGTWYFKSVDGAFGNQVCKVVVKQQQIISVHIPKLHRAIFEQYNHAHVSEISPEMLLTYMVIPKSNGCPSPIGKPIIEGAIPREEINGIIAEQRVVFCFNYVPQYLCSYSKVALAENVYPNRAQGGDAEPIRDSFRRILESRLSLTGEELERQIENTVVHMKLIVGQFAENFIEKTTLFGYSYGPLFAVDVCPVWNQELMQIEFWLLEVQAGPGTQGAFENIPADEVEAVERYNAIDDFDFMQ